MFVKIINPDVTVFSGQADAVYAPGELGEIGILEDHAPLAAVLKDGIIEIISGEKKREFPITEGVLEVKNNNEVVILV